MVRIRTTNNRRRARVERRAWADAAGILRKWLDEAVHTSLEAYELRGEQAPGRAFFITFDPEARALHYEPIDPADLYRKEEE